MSIEQKIAEILAESRNKAQLDEANPATKNAVAGDQSPITGTDSVTPASEVAPAGSGNTGKEANHLTGTDSGANPDNAKNNVEDQDDAEEATTKKSNPATAKAAAGDQSAVKVGKDNVSAVKEDIDALMNGEELSEEFREKATTIFESAVMARVHAEVARLEEEFEAKLAEQVAQNVEGLVEQVDGYLGYVAEQWIAQNELALESGMKSEILEGFVNGLKGLFEEHYIDVPEERFDVLGEMEAKMAELEEKLNETVAANIEMAKVISEATRNEIVATVCEGLSDTETEKFLALAEELAYEDAESFEGKVKTIRENYFTNKATAEVSSVVTDAPVENLTEQVKTIDPTMSAYLSALNK